MKFTQRNQTMVGFCAMALLVGVMATLPSLSPQQVVAQDRTEGSMNVLLSLTGHQPAANQAQKAKKASQQQLKRLVRLARQARARQQRQLQAQKLAQQNQVQIVLATPSPIEEPAPQPTEQSTRSDGAMPQESVQLAAAPTPPVAAPSVNEPQPQPEPQRETQPDPEPQAAPESAPVSLPSVYFTQGFPQTYQHGSGASLSLAVSNALAPGDDLLLLAWSVNENRLVDAFAHSLRNEPWRFDNAKLDLLPEGQNILQVLVRRNGQPRQQVHRQIEVVRAPQPPSLAFASAIQSYQQGSGQHVDLQVQGDMPAGGDVLVIAWSYEHNALVDAFAHSLTAAPWRISSQQLDKLPAGRVELQVLLRDNARVQQRVTREITVQPMLPTLSFAGAASTYQHGSGQAISLQLSGPLPAGADVLLLAWSDDENRMVDGVTRALTASPWRFTSEQLDQLPTGRVNLQAQLRVDGKVQRRADQWITVEPAPPPPPPALPTLTFAAGAPGTFEQGAAPAIALALSGPMPDNADVLLLAWSEDHNQMVAGFDQVLRGNPWTFSAAKLNSLSAGRINLQALLRLDGKPQQQVNHWVTVTAPPEPDPEPEPAPEPEPEPDPEPEPAPEPGEPGKGGNDQTQNPSPPDDGGHVPGDGSDEPTPAPTVNLSFAAGAPTQYVKGSGKAIALKLDGPLPANSDVLLMAWSDTTQSMVDPFVRQLTDAPWQFSAEQLDLLPNGTAQIQAMLRISGKPSRLISHGLTVVASEVGDDEPPTVPGDEPGDEEPIGGEPSNEGFTPYQPLSDSRVIYVSASGDDNRDGQSPATAVRTPQRGYDLLRNGHPDYLLFRRGDVFDLPSSGNRFREFSKSGRSAAEPMVVGAYGDSAKPRPRFNTNGGRFLNVHTSGGVRYVTFMDLHAYANLRDPGGSQFKYGVIENGIQWGAPLEHVRFEGMLFEFFTFHAVFNNGSIGRQTNLTFHRNVLRNAYNPHTLGHSSAAYFQRIRNLTLRENYFDHNGWNPNVSQAGRSGFNHDVYIHHGQGVLVEGNIFSRESFGNLKLRSDIVDGLRDVTVRRNVFLCSRLVMAATSDAVDGVPNGIVIRNLTFEDNLVTQFGTSGPQDQASVYSRVGDVNIRRNLYVHKVPPYSFRVVQLNNERENLNISGNIVYNWPDVDGWGTVRDLIPKGHGVNLINPPASRFVDPTRTIQTYHQQLGQAPTAEAFIEQMRQQSRHHWREAYTAEQVLRYFKQGFELTPHD